MPRFDSDPAPITTPPPLPPSATGSSTDDAPPTIAPPVHPARQRSGGPDPAPPTSNLDAPPPPEPAPDEPVQNEPASHDHAPQQWAPPSTTETVDTSDDVVIAATPVADVSTPAPVTEPKPAAEPRRRPVDEAADSQRLVLRQVAGLTAGTEIELDIGLYDFAEGESSTGFRIEVDEQRRVLVMPGPTEATIDTVAVVEPTPLGTGVLDVGSARFMVRAGSGHRRATDWLDQHEAIEEPTPPIVVPDLPEVPETPEPAPAPKRRFGRRRRALEPAAEVPALDAQSWEFVEQVRSVRADVAARERYHHPDPTELAYRAKTRAPILGVRPPGHPLFAKAGVVMADMPWMPDFDDVDAIPESLGLHLRPLMSLPSIPIPADLGIGPLGIAGSRAAARACARHVLLSLYASSTADLRLHIASNRPEAWEWADVIVSERPVQVGDGLSVVAVDGMDAFEHAGVDHFEAIDATVGLVVLADTVEELPSYCGTVLQVDLAGSGLLTNHLGHIISGTPIGIDELHAADLADDLRGVMTARGR